MTDLPADPTLEEIRAALAPLVARNAAFDGWSEAAVALAAQQAGVAPEAAQLAFAGGAMTMIDAWFAHIDTAMAASCTPERLAPLKVREKIATLIETRLALLAPDREALRRALAILAMPRHMPRAAKLGWRAADAMWLALGDRSTDYNYYTKRTTLSAVYAATLLAFINDESERHAETSAFLARRIEGVMRFEKMKAQLGGHPERRPSLTRFVGRLRYPAR